MEGGILLSTGKDLYFKLDPRTKIILMIVLNFIIFTVNDEKYTLLAALFPLILLASSKKIKSAIKLTIFLLFSAAAYVFLAPILHGILNFLVVMVSYTIYRLMPGFIMGYYIVTTTTVSEFVGSMEKIHLPNEIIIPFSVIFRFFPTLFREFKSIIDAMKMREVVFNLKKPLKTVEFCLVPMLMSSVKIGEELSVASLTRGLGSPVKRTNICDVGFNIQDYLLIILITILVLLIFIFQ